MMPLGEQLITGKRWEQIAGEGFAVIQWYAMNASMTIRRGSRENMWRNGAAPVKWSGASHEEREWRAETENRECLVRCSKVKIRKCGSRVIYGSCAVESTDVSGWE